MIAGQNLVDGQWIAASGPAFESLDPAAGECLWRGPASTAEDVDRAVGAARRAFADWSRRPFPERLAILEAYAGLLERDRESLAELIARETGKPLWDALGEATAMAGKIAISKAAHEERTPDRAQEHAGVRQRLRHRPHGVMAVFGPYNFPGHLPNGHIAPALLAGNTVVFKPSELTPAVAARMGGIWQEAGLPDGVLNIVQGAKDTGVALAGHDDIDGILFTGSVPTGMALHRQLAGRPDILLALEMGGNNPLVVHNAGDPEAAAMLIVQSAFVTAGQRCTCARRLIVPAGKAGDLVVDALAGLIDRIRISAWNDRPEPFMGPLIDDRAADRTLAMTARLLEAGGRSIRPLIRLERGDAFLTPALIDVTALDNRPDEEIFGPVLQLIRTRDYEAALLEANATRFGLAAGLISDDAEVWADFSARARAGIVNWNRPLTGASSAAPFGGIGLSGNHRPSAFYAADYVAWPMASLEDASGRAVSTALPKGIGEASND